MKSPASFEIKLYLFNILILSVVFFSSCQNPRIKKKEYERLNLVSVNKEVLPKNGYYHTVATYPAQIPNDLIKEIFLFQINFVKWQPYFEEIIPEEYKQELALTNPGRFARYLGHGHLKNALTLSKAKDWMQAAFKDTKVAGEFTKNGEKLLSLGEELEIATQTLLKNMGENALDPKAWNQRLRDFYNALRIDAPATYLAKSPSILSNFWGLPLGQYAFLPEAFLKTLSSSFMKDYLALRGKGLSALDALSSASSTAKLDPYAAGQIIVRGMVISAFLENAKNIQAKISPDMNKNVVDVNNYLNTVFSAVDDFFVSPDFNTSDEIVHVTQFLPKNNVENLSNISEKLVSGLLRAGKALIDNPASRELDAFVIRMGKKSSMSQAEVERIIAAFGPD